MLPEAAPKHVDLAVLVQCEREQMDGMGWVKNKSYHHATATSVYSIGMISKIEPVWTVIHFFRHVKLQRSLGSSFDKCAYHLLVYAQWCAARCVLHVVWRRAATQTL